MKMKLKTILSIFFLLSILSACKNKNEDLKYLPANANFVMILTPSILQDKSGIENLSQTKVYESMVSDLDSSSKLVFSQFEYVFQNYKESGINISSPIFVFSSSKNNGYNKIYGVNFRIQNAEKFNILMGKVADNSGDSMELTSDGDLTLIIYNKVNSKKIIAWNNTAVVAFSKSNGNSNTSLLIQQAHELFDQSLSNSLASNNDFNDFYNNNRDISIWIDSKFMMQRLPAEYQTIAKMQMPISMDNVYFHYFIQFDKGIININSELKLPKDLKNFLKDYKIVKTKTDKKMMGFIPKNSLMNISFSINPPELLRMIRDLYSERQIDTKGMEQLFEIATNIKVERLFESISGDFIFNIHDVKIINDNQDSLASKKAKWMFSSIFKLDDEKVYQWLISQADKNHEKMKDGYLVLDESADFPLFISIKNTYVMLTNDKSLIINFSEDISLENSLNNSNIADKMNNYSAYAEFNLDYSSYSNEVQQYFNNKYEAKHKIAFKNKISKIRFEPIDSYTAQLLIDFKDKNQNSLRQIMSK